MTAKKSTKKSTAKTAVQPAKQDTKGLAIASMVCGILGLLAWWSLWFGFACSLVGAVMGIICLSKQSKDDGKGMAVAGIVTGAIGAFISGLFIGLVMFFGVAVSESSSIDKIIENIESDPTNMDVDVFAE